MRRIMKGVLFFGGLAITVTGMALFFANFLSLKTLVLRDAYVTSIVWARR